jgi:MoxR-like ATPase
MLTRLLIALFTGGHLLLQGVPGMAKAAGQIAAVVQRHGN